MVPIAYGYPIPEMIEAAKRDEIVLGGCFIKKDNYYCLSCNEAQTIDIALDL